MELLKKTMLLILSTLYAFAGFSQTPLWLNTFGGNSSNQDIGYVTRVAPNGNVLVGGFFTGTIDLDPSSTTYNLTSYNGSQDMFLACYTSTGSFVWGFAIGKDSYDGILCMAIDANNNVFVGGYFRGTNVDFDPGPGSALYTGKGWTGVGSGAYGGDAFIAKYSSTGAFQWVNTLQSPWAYEETEALCVDNAGNLIAGGCYKDTIDFDPGPGTKILNSNTDGEGFLAKYTTNGALLWAFGFGKPGIAATDNALPGIQVDNNNNIYLAGRFQNYPGGSDFDPGPGTAILNAIGYYDMFIAKYSAAGNYIFAKNIGATSNAITDARNLALDANYNMYVTAYTNANSIDLDPSSATANATLTPGGGYNIILAKYNSNGQYVWGKLIGGTSDDLGYDVTVSNSTVLTTGYFSNTVNFNPGGTPANMVSTGSSDIFVARYDLNGNYQCSFKVGSASVDEGHCITTDASGKIYLSGGFSGSNTDFDPGTSTLNASSNGNTDIFLAKYDWPTNPVKGYLVGDTVCQGEQAYLTYIDTAGNTTTTITYSDGTNSYSKTVQSNVPFTLIPNPTNTKTFTLTGGSGASPCSTAPGNSVQVVVNPQPVAFAGNDTAICPVISLQLHGTGTGNYYWYSTAPIINPTTANPGITVNNTAIYYLVVTGAAGCADTDDIKITANPVPAANAGNDTTVCPRDIVSLHGSGGSNYFWFPNTNMINNTTATPSVTISNNISYFLSVSNSFGCSDTDQVDIFLSPVFANAGKDTTICPDSTLQLNGSGNGIYQWYPASAVSNPNIANPYVKIKQNIAYTLVVTNTIGCRDTDDVSLSIIPFNSDITPKAADLCAGDSVIISASGGNIYLWWPDNNLSGNTTSMVKVHPSLSTRYYVAIKELACMRTDTLSSNIIINLQPDVTINKSNDINCSKGYTILTASGADSYLWIPNEYLDNATSSAPTARPRQTTIYTAIGTSLHGCKDTSTIQVDVIGTGDLHLITPDAFTPNNDGKNDCYRIITTVYLDNYDLYIYNRWGQQVFHSTDVNECWDGTFKGQQLELGTYYYYYKLKTEACGEIFHKGDIQLIR
jgi:gliding motility-associated-like protein